MSKSAETLPAPVNHVDGLDGLRGIAVIGVILYHLFPDTIKGGFLGVSLFFVLSGYLIAVTSEKYCSAGKFEVFTFYKKRFQRIYPPLIIVVFISVGVLSILEPSLINGMRREVLSIFLGYNNLWQVSQNSSYFAKIANASPFTHLWSLAIELQFYFVWPLLYRIYQKMKKGGSAYSWYVFGIPAFVSVLCMQLFFQQDQDVTNVYYGTITRMFSLFLGVLVALRSKNNRAKHLSRNRGKKKIQYFLFLFVVLLLSYRFMDGQSAFTYRIGFLATSILFCEIVKLAIHPQLPVGKWLDWKPLSWIGKKSYEIYLWQYPVIFAFGYFQWDCFGLSPLVMTGIILMLSVWLQEVLKYMNMKFGGNKNMKQIKKVSFGIVTYFLAVTFVLGGCSVVSEPDTKQESQQKLQEELERNAETLKEQNHEIQNPATEMQDSHMPDSITAIGDSVMLGASPSIQELIPGCVVDASESRQVVQAEKIVNNLKQQGTLGNTVIIALGTNGSFDSAVGQKLIDQLGTEREIYWITAYGKHLQWQDSVNDMIRQLAENNENIHVIDWAEQAAVHPEWLYDDGIHLNPSGQEAYTKLILEHIF